MQCWLCWWLDQSHGIGQLLASWEALHVWRQPRPPFSEIAKHGNFKGPCLRAVRYESRSLASQAASCADRDGSSHILRSIPVDVEKSS